MQRETRRSIRIPAAIEVIETKRVFVSWSWRANFWRPLCSFLGNSFLDDFSRDIGLRPNLHYPCLPEMRFRCARLLVRRKRWDIFTDFCGIHKKIATRQARRDISRIASRLLNSGKENATLTSVLPHQSTANVCSSAQQDIRFVLLLRHPFFVCCKRHNFFTIVCFC